MHLKQHYRMICCRKNQLDDDFLLELDRSESNLDLIKIFAINYNFFDLK